MGSSGTTPGLQGMRVLEVGEMVAAPYAAKLLGDQGADVIKVEPPRGDRARERVVTADGLSPLFLGLNANKRSVVCDLDSVDGRSRLAGLVAETDIVIHSLGAVRAAEVGLDGADLLDRHPAIVVCAITPFGQTGPHAEYRGEELSVFHGGGWGWLVPGDATDVDLPPLKVAGHVVGCQAGMAGAMAAVAACRKAVTHGVGEFIDLSEQALVASMLEAAFIAWTYRGDEPHRTGGRLLNPWKILPCSDGLIFGVTVEADQWDRLVDLMGSPAWAQLEVFADFTSRAENADMLYVYLEEWTRQFTVDELFHLGQAHRICFAPVFQIADLPRQQHLIDRGFFADLADSETGPLTHLGSPYVASPSAWSLRSPAPKLGEHANATFEAREKTSNEARSNEAPSDETISLRPLAGIRVIDFSWVWAGPFCTLHLSHLGAEVIKVESSGRPGLGRRLPISPLDVDVTLNTSGYFNQWDQGKKSVEIDLGAPDSIDTVLGLLATADVVVDNYATGVMDRLGLSDEQMREANPDLVIASITGYGHSGPLASYMGYGPTTAPLSGLTSITGHVGGKPEEAGLSFGDPAAGMAAAFGIVAALETRRRHGHPTRVDVSLWEATAVNAVEPWMIHALGGDVGGPDGNRDRFAAPHGCYRCAGDDNWVTIACMSDAEWQRFATVIAPAMGGDERFATAAARKQNEDALDDLVQEWCAGQDKWAITTRLQAAGVAAYPTLDMPEVEANPQLIARKFFERFDHDEVGSRTHAGVPWRMHNSENGVVHVAPLLGQHTADYLS